MSPVDELAYHEAGHIVIGRKLGMRFTKLDIAADGLSGVAYLNGWLSAAPRDRVVSMLAGSLAEARATGRPVEELLRTSGVTDLAKAQGVVAEIVAAGGDEPRAWALAWAKTAKLVDRHWPEIERVATTIIAVRRYDPTATKLRKSVFY